MSDAVPHGETLKSAYIVERLLTSDPVCESYALCDLQKTRSLLGLRVLPTLAAVRGYLSWFEDHAKRLLGIRHRNLAPVIDYVIDGPGRCFLILEEPIGHTLRTELTLPRQQSALPRPLSFARSQHIYRQIAEALDALHQGHCLHLDLRPETVFLNSAGDDQVQVTLTGMGLVAPTLWHTIECPDALLPYQAPEQLLREPATEKSDIFSLASLIYEMHKGAQAFRRQGDDRVAVLSKIQREDPIPFAAPSQAVPGFSRALNKAHYKSPQQRHASIRDFCHELGISLAVTKTPPKPAFTKRASQRLWWTLGGGSLCVLVILAIVLASQVPGVAKQGDGGLAATHDGGSDGARLLLDRDAAPLEKPADATARRPDLEAADVAHVGQTATSTSGTVGAIGGPAAGTTTQHRDKKGAAGAATAATSASSESSHGSPADSALNRGSTANATGTGATGNVVAMEKVAATGKDTPQAQGERGEPSGAASNTGKEPGNSGKQPGTASNTGKQPGSVGSGSKPPGGSTGKSGRPSPPHEPPAAVSCASVMRASVELPPEQQQILRGCLQSLRPCSGVATIRLVPFNGHYSVSASTPLTNKHASEFRDCVRHQLKAVPDTGEILIKKED